MVCNEALFVSNEFVNLCASVHLRNETAVVSLVESVAFSVSVPVGFHLYENHRI